MRKSGLVVFHIFGAAFLALILTDVGLATTVSSEAEVPLATDVVSPKATSSTQILPHDTSSDRIHWQSWDTPAFDRARKEDKLVLLDLTSVWCHACHMMERTTYADGEVIDLLNRQFVPIRVDSDQRPDIEARYRQGGWPTTAVLLQTGEILYQGNFLDPEDMKIVLEDTLAAYREHKEEFQSQAAKVWSQIEQALAEKTLPETSIEQAILAQSVATMYQSFDPIHGGFRRAPKFFEPEAIHFGFLHFHRTREESMKQMMLKTLDEQLVLFDAEWGGFFRYAENPDWTNPHYEKVLQVQANNLLNYLEAYQVTGDQRYRQVVEQLSAYVAAFLTNPQRDGFFSSQNSFVGQVPGKQYYQYPDRQRRSIGLPQVDTSMYTHSNAKMIRAYLRAYQVLGREQYKDLALQTLEAMFRERFQAGLGMAHSVVQGIPKWNGILQNQTSFGHALVEAYFTTGKRTYLERAVQLVDIMIERLEDQQGGGFYDRPRVGDEEGLLRFSQKPIKENVDAAILLTTLSHLTHKPQYLEKAKLALRVVLTSESALPIALLGTAVDRVLNYPLNLVVIGESANPKTKALYQQAMRLYIPGKIVRLLDPDRDSLQVGEVTFPVQKFPQAFVCTDKFCSPPITDPDQLPGRAQLVLVQTEKSRVSGKPSE